MLSGSPRLENRKRGEERLFGSQKTGGWTKVVRNKKRFAIGPRSSIPLRRVQGLLPTGEKEEKEKKKKIERTLSEK